MRHQKVSLSRLVCLLLSLVTVCLPLFSCGDDTPAGQNGCVITLDANGGTALKPLNAQPGEQITLPDPKRAEYTFKCWTLNGSPVSSPYTVTESVTLVAEWESGTGNEKYTVHFDSDGGSYVADVEVIKGKLFVLPAPPTKEGYEFDCWKDEDGVSYIDDAVLDVEDELFLHAVWKEAEETTSEDTTTEEPEETTRAPETTKAQTTKAPETTRIQTTKAPETTTKAPETTKAPVSAKAPEITAQPKSAEFDVGGSVTFSVTATGDNLTYQWYQGSTAIKDATGSSCTVSGLKAENDGQKYHVVVKNSAGSKTSNDAVITFAPSKPVITLQPVAQNFDENENITFKVEAKGKGLIYIWYKNGVDIDGADKSTYTTSDLKASDNGAKYYCKVLDSSKNEVRSNEVAITYVAGKPRITVQPASTTFADGDTVTLSIKVVGTGVTYQWYRSGAKLDGETFPTLKLTNLTKDADKNEYYCAVKNDKIESAILSARATLTFATSAPKIKSVTCDAEKNEFVKNQIITFDVVATGGDLNYKWYYIAPGDTTAQPVTGRGSTTSSISTNKMHERFDGMVYYCEVSNDKGKVTSDKITLKYAGAPFVLECNDDVTVNKVNDKFTLSMKVIGAGKITYQWFIYEPVPGTTQFSRIPRTDIEGSTFETTYYQKYGDGIRIECIISSDAFPGTTVTQEFEVSLKKAQ